jgi:uncharacterized protein (TIGR02594 family)
MLILKFGDKGKEVYKLQSLLSNKNKSFSGLDVDGEFGEKTKDAVISFQKNNDLTPDGIVGPKTAELLGLYFEDISDNVPNWFQIATKEIGVIEYSASGEDNKRIVEYHHTTTLDAENDEVPWCSSFVNWCIEKAGIKGTDSAAAISWSSWGQKDNNPSVGTVVVIRHKNKNNMSSTGSSSGNHVAFFVSEDDDYIELLGGNQSNQVKISRFIKNSFDIIAYRKPT